MKELFGGSESKSTNQQKATSQYTSATDPVDLTPGAFTDLQSPFAKALSGLVNMASGQLGQTLTSGTSPGQAQSWQSLFSVPQTANETELLGGLMGDQRSGARPGYLDSVLSGNFLPGQAGANPFLQAAIETAQRPTLQGLEEVLSRTLPGRFTQAGQFVNPQGSSAFDRAAAIATRGTADALGDIATKMSFGSYEGERGRQQEAVGLSQQEVDTTIKNLEAQQMPRLIQQHGIETGLKEWQTRVSALLEVLRTVGGVTAPVIAQKSEAQGGSESKGSAKSSSDSSAGIVPAFTSMFKFGGGV